MIVKLAGQLTPAHNPDVTAAGDRGHLRVNGTDIAVDEADVDARHRRLRARAEHPRRLRVRPRLLMTASGTDDVPQHPPVCGGAHGYGPHLLDEVREAGRVDVTERKQPLERIVRRREEPVKAGRGVVLRLHMV